jgi:uncharacterized integral membrane protein
MRTVKMIITAILFILALGFGILNNESITVSYYAGSIKTTSGFALILFFVMGGLLGLIFGMLRKKK